MSDFKPNIWRLQAQFDTQGLIRALGDDDPDIRKRSAAALRTMGATAAIPALQTTLANEQDDDARIIIAAALEYLMGEANRESTQSPETSRIVRLIAQLSSPDVEQVAQAAKALGELKNKSAVEPLVMLFHNNHKPTRARLAAAEALIELDSAPAEVTLLVALRSEKWYLRRNAAAILGQLRSNWAVEPLAAALRDESEIVRKTALAALRRIATPEALKVVRVHDPAIIENSVPAPPEQRSASLAPTKPLNPKTAEEAEAARRLQRSKDPTKPLRPNLEATRPNRPPNFSPNNTPSLDSTPNKQTGDEQGKH